MQACTEGRPFECAAETLVVLRERQGGGSWKHDCLLSKAALTTPLTEYAQVFKAEHRIENRLERAKREAGPADQSGADLSALRQAYLHWDKPEMFNVPAP